MKRNDEMEILEQPGLSSAAVAEAYRDLARIHCWLGDTRAVVRAIRRDGQPVRRVLDVGCGTGLVLEQVGKKLGVDVVGIDLRPCSSIGAAVQILQADARFDLMPEADVAFSMHLGHHLNETDLELMIRNVGRSCRRFILLDLVRHPLPLVLFRLFIAPIVCAIDAEDGRRSIQRSYTPEELHAIAAAALADTGAQFSLSVSRGYLRQVLDIRYSGDARRKHVIRTETVPQRC